MDTPAAEPSSYGTFDTLCGLVAGSAVIMLAVGACLLLGALVTYANADQPGTADIAKLESKALAASFVSYGVTCFTSGIPLLIFSYGGWIFLDLARNNRLQVQKTDDLARNNRLQVQKTDEVLKHLAEINPKYEERLRREQEAAQRRAEAEQEATQRRAEAEQEATQRKAEKERQEALARWTAEREQLDRKRLAEEERQKALAAAAKEQENERQQRITDARNDAQIEFDQILAKARKAYRLSEPAQVEQLTDEICADIDKLFARLADIDQRFTIKLTKEIGDQFAQHQSFKSLNINLEPA